MRRALMLFAALPLLAHDWLIVPGARVGPVTATSTEAKLRAAFGDAAVVRSMIRTGRTTTAPGIEVYRDTPGESLAVVWPRREGSLWWPLLVIPCYHSTSAGCRWRTASGVRPGSTLKELEELNTRPFRLFLASDVRAWTEARWEEGELARELGEDVELYFDEPADAHDHSAYFNSNRQPLNEGIRRIDRMFVFLLSNGKTSPPNDWMVGGRFWSLLASAPVEPLRETLGADKVHRSIEELEEGLGDLPAIVFGDHVTEVRRRQDGRVFPCGGQEGCKWRLPARIPWSMTLKSAENLNGRPFVFNGFGWDYGGKITSWENGRVPKLLAEASIVVDCGDDAPAAMGGEVQLRSNDPEVRKLKCTVSVLSLFQAGSAAR